MTTIAHPDILDLGLSLVSTGTINIIICQTEPLNLSDCTSLSGSGGKRVSSVLSITGEPTITDGINSSSRKLNIPSKTFTDGILVGVNSVGADLWLAVYDATRLLLKTDTIINQELVQGGSVITPGFEFGIQQV